MTRSGWSLWVSFVAGLIAGGAATLTATLALHVQHIVLTGFHPAVPSWVSLLLGSSVVATVSAALLTAWLNVRAIKMTRAGSLSDKAFAAYLPFNDEARQYLARMETFTGGRPSTKLLTARYDDAHAWLSRITGAAGQQLRLLEEVHSHLAGWPRGPAGLPGAATAYAATAHERLDALESSMRDLGNGHPRLSSPAAGKSA